MLHAFSITLSTRIAIIVGRSWIHTAMRALIQDWKYNPSHVHCKCNTRKKGPLHRRCIFNHTTSWWETSDSFIHLQSCTAKDTIPQTCMAEFAWWIMRFLYCITLRYTNDWWSDNWELPFPSSMKDETADLRHVAFAMDRGINCLLRARNLGRKVH